MKIQERLMQQALQAPDIQLNGWVNLLRGEALAGDFSRHCYLVRVDPYGAVDGLLKDVVNEKLDFLEFVREEGIDVLFGSKAVAYKDDCAVVADDAFSTVAAALFVAHHFAKAGYSELPVLTTLPVSLVWVWDGEVKACNRVRVPSYARGTACV